MLQGGSTWKCEQLVFNCSGQSISVVVVCHYKAVTSLASWTRERSTIVSLLSWGDSNRKSNTRSMTTSFPGGVGRGNSSSCAVWFGDRRRRTSSWTGDERDECHSQATCRLQIHLDFSLLDVPDLPQRSFGWACKSRWWRQNLRRNQSCSSAILHCDWL